MDEKTEMQKLMNLRDAIVDSIMEMSEDETDAELKEDGLDPAKVAKEMRAILNKAISDFTGEE